MAKLIFKETVEDVTELATAAADPPPILHEAIGESLEVRFWGRGGKPGQFFNIGSGTNFDAQFNVWTEVAYTIHGAQIFYTRTFLHLFDAFDPQWVEETLHEMLETGEGEIALVGMLPESSISLKMEKRSYENFDGTKVEYSDCRLEISADTGAVFAESSPGIRSVSFNVIVSDIDAAVQFMRDLAGELSDALEGKRPNPALLPPGASEWPFVRQLNLKAYNAISEDYQESYFANPLLAEAFDGWMAQMPYGARVLDAGCGHGHPVITRLLEKGFQVTGTDISPAMLKKARERFPQMTFYEKATPEIDFTGEFDAACSFSSTLYLDPIDLFHSIYRLYQALKPGGLLFLYSYDLHPAWRGHPLDQQMKEWLWYWTYGMDEVAQALEEHGLFEVLNTCNVTTEQEREARLARIRQQMEEEEKKFEEMKARFHSAQEESQEDEALDTENLNGVELDEDSSVEEEMESEGGEETPEFDINSLLSHTPKVPEAEERITYHYVVVARRK